MRTKNLKIGDQLETASGITLDVQDIQVKRETTRVYNFSVQEYHSYFVTNLMVWTHNTNKCKIVYPSKPHTNKTPGHWEAMVEKAEELAQTGDYKEIYLNKGLSNVAELNGNPNRRPDIMAVRNNGLVDQYEVPSKTDSIPNLRNRMVDNQRILGDKAGEITILLAKEMRR